MERWGRKQRERGYPEANGFVKPLSGRLVLHLRVIRSKNRLAQCSIAGVVCSAYLEEILESSGQGSQINNQKKLTNPGIRSVPEIFGFSRERN